MEQQYLAAGRVKAVASGSSKPSVSFAVTLQSKSSTSRPHHTLPYEDDPGAVADVDDEEDDEDDANPMQTPTSHLNPLRLLNQALEHGAHATVRQYRRNCAAFHNQSMLGIALADSDTKRRRISFQDDGKMLKLVCSCFFLIYYTACSFAVSILYSFQVYTILSSSSDFI